MSSIDRYYYRYSDDDGQDWYIIIDRNSGDEVATVKDRILTEQICKALNTMVYALSPKMLDIMSKGSFSEPIEKT